MSIYIKCAIAWWVAPQAYTYASNASGKVHQQRAALATSFYSIYPSLDNCDS